MASTGRMSGDERRAQLLETARTEFARDGYRATTTASIAAAAGVSEALVHKHFGTKEMLFRSAVIDPIVELVERQIAANREELSRGRLRDTEDAFDGVREFLAVWGTTVRQHRSLVLSVIRESTDFPDAAAHLAGLVRSEVDELVATMESIVAASDAFRAYDVRVAVYAGLAGVTLAGLLPDEELDPFIDGLVDLLRFGAIERA